MQDLGNWIFKPEQISISYSSNGKDFEGSLFLNDEENNINKNTFKGKFSIEKPFTARYLKINIKNIGVCPPTHKGAGSKAWLFIDELYIE